MTNTHNRILRRHSYLKISMRSLSNHHETAVSFLIDIAHKIGGLTLITVTDHTCLARINLGSWENTHLPLP